MNPRRLSAALVTLLVCATAARAGGKIESATLASSAPVSWEDRHHQRIDARQIADGKISIRLEHCSDIAISTCDLRAVELIDCTDITLENCYIHDSPRCGVDIGSCQGVTVRNCRLERVSSGVYAVDSKKIQVIGNFARNMVGPMPRGQLAQFDTVTGPANVIRGNYVINERGENHSEDEINLYKSAGDADSPIIVEDNYLTGDPKSGSEGMSKSGSGIMLGDCGGANQLCRHNVVISAGQCGIGVAGGSSIRVENNLIFGQKSDVSNVGLYAWNQSHHPSKQVTVINNRVYWLMPTGEENSWWNGGGITEFEKKANHFADATLAEQVPAPPSEAPMPPGLVAGQNDNKSGSVTVPWKLR